MRSKSEVLKEHYGIDNALKAMNMLSNDIINPTWPPLDQYTKMKIPYEAPNSPSIPTIEEIEEGMKHNSLRMRVGLRPICKVGNCVVKQNIDPSLLQEAENMLFLQENSKVRVPKLYAAFVYPYQGASIYTIVMEFIDGETLSQDKWLAFSDETQSILCSKVAEQFQLLRAVPSQGYYGRVHHQGWDPRFPPVWTRNKHMCGPYDTFEDMVSALYTTAELRLADQTISIDYYPSELSFLSRFKSGLSNNQRSKPVLTHPDPSFQNIIIKPIRQGENTIDWEVFLIDLYGLGWLPACLQIPLMELNIELFNKPDKQKFGDRVYTALEDSYEEDVELFAYAAHEAGHILFS